MPRPSIVSLVSLAAVAVLILGLALFWFGRAPAVPALTLQAGPLVRTLQFSGRVATASRVEVGSTLTGRVLQVAVDEGAGVRAGDVLVRLEDSELRAALAQAQAGEQQAAARLAGLRSTGRSGALAALAQADSVLLTAQADLRRAQDLVAQGFVSPAQLDQARRAVDVARAQQDAARAQRSANADQGTDVAQAQAQVALAQSATAAARARLDQAVVRAPADARVLARSVEPGQIVQPGRALLTLALAGALQLVAPVDERFLEQLRVGQPAMVLADAFPEQRFAATVLSIAPLVDAQRGAVEVKFNLPAAPPAFLREDMTLSIEVETGRRASALVVPASALRPAAAGSDAQAAVVYRERGGRVEARAVRLGLRTLDAAEVLAGLAAGDTVLLGDTPQPGSRVRADRAAAPAARGATHDDPGSTMTNAMGR